MNLTEISESIQTSLSGLSQAKADIKSAITEKGGTVSEGAKFGDLAAAVGTISTGSGTPTNGWYPTEWDADGYITKIKVVGLTAIPDAEFYNISTARGAFVYLTSVDLPNDLEGIIQYAFYCCSRLALTSLPDGITSIETYTFYGCTNLALTSLPAGIKSIGNYAFSGCTNLALTSLPSGLTSIESSVFSGCTKLALTSLPNGIVSIDSYAFKGCTGLTSITFQGTPTTINSTSFNGCTNLLTINVPWAEGAVANAPWGATNATINYNYTGG